jgi:hypothetical protein
MRPSRIGHASRRLAPAALAAACLLASCQFPTDRSDEVFVTIDSPSSVVVRGATMTLTARAWRRVSGGGRVEVPGVSLRWSSSDERVATVASAAAGRAIVAGIGEGPVTIDAIALDYREADPGAVTLRVANTVEIDSVRPMTARYGEQLTVYGVGLGEIAQVSLAGTPLIADSLSFVGDPAGIGRLRFWLPYPAASGVLSAVAKQGSSVSAPDTTSVLPYDIYDDGGDLPAVIDLNGPALFPPDTLFSNPALVLEPGQIQDVYRLSRSDTTGPVSFIVSTALPVVFGFEPVLLPGPAATPTFPDPDISTGWSIGVSGQHCEVDVIAIERPFPRTAPVTVVRAFRQLPARDLLLVVYGEPVGRYGLAVVDRYVVADPAIQPDRFEDDDNCPQADANFTDPGRRINLTDPFTDTLTIDNPYEVDWLRFTIPEPDTTLLTIRTAARPFGASDSSDIGLVVRRVGSFFSAIESHAPGSAEILAIQVGPGDYYLAVIDEAGLPTRYSVCMAIGTACPLLGASVRPSPSQGQRP